MIKREDLGDGVVALVFDRPDSDVNYLDMTAVALFDSLVAEGVDDPAVIGVVIASAKKTFVAGGDLKELQAVKTIEQAEAMVAAVQATLRRMETAPKPFVAAVNGLALGGGLELALACTYRLGSDDEQLALGLPEVTLGLMPGAGGTQRLPRIVGIEAALPMLLEGRQISGEAAQESGLLNERVAPDALLSVAKQRILSAAAPVDQPWDREVFVMPAPALDSEEAKILLEAAQAKIDRRKAGLEPAPQAIFDSMSQGLMVSIDEGLAIERSAFGKLAAGTVAKNKIRTLFYGVNAAASMKDRPADIPPYNISNVAVIGVGLMGSGIAYCAALAGHDVQLVDVSADVAAAAEDRIGKTAARSVERGRLSQDAADKLVARLHPTSDYGDLAGVDMVFEAVAEIPDVKHGVIEQASAAVKAGVPIASNTSTIPITSLAQHATRGAELIGLHFFAPVDRMKLVEVIRGDQTNQATVARALDFLAGIRKTPIVVNDGLGFFTSRVVGAYTGEALTLLAEGIPPSLVDDVALKAGMPIGPLAMADATSLTLLRDIFASIIGDGSRIGLAGMRAAEVLETLAGTLGRGGKAAGAGIYDYDDGRAVEWSGLREHFPSPTTAPDRELIEKRLLHAQALESVRAIEDKVIGEPIDADVGSVLGWAFPSAYGGVIGYIDTIGVDRFVRECDELAEACGGRFIAPTMLRHKAAAGEPFYIA